ncbi:hypothetical protein Hanom_Chr00s000002g01600881 [Helianthus anomalus]
MEMNSVCVHGLFLFIYLGGHFSWRRVSLNLQLTPRYGFTSYELVEGKREREERGAVIGGSQPSHHHGLHRRRATTTSTISTLWYLLLSMIERGMCGVRERNGVMGIAPPLQEVPASSRFCGFVVSATCIVVVSPPTMIVACLLATLSRQEDDDLLDLSLLV